MTFPGLAALLLGVCLAVPASALTVERTDAPTGERPTSSARKDIGHSLWRPRALPSSTFMPRPSGSSLSAKPAASGFRLKEVPAKLRERTQTLLREFGAREKDGRIVISLPGDVLFDFDKSDIRADARPALGRLIEVLKAYPKAPVLIEGHTDAKGEDAYNLALSDRRAASVKAYLARGKIAVSRLSMHGLGETRPVALNTKPDGSDDPDGRQRNRRVEFIIGR